MKKSFKIVVLLYVMLIAVTNLFGCGKEEKEDVKSENETEKTLQAIELEKIKYTLNGKNIKISEEEWIIKNIKEINIEEEKIDQDKNIEEVIVSVIIEDEVMEANGKLKLTYEYDDEWIYKEMKIVEEFKTVFREDTKLEITDEILLNEILKYEVKYGEKKTDMGNGTELIDYSTQQTVSMTMEEISDFKVIDYTIRDKGKCQQYSCSFMLNKNKVTFLINTSVTYLYLGSDGWQVQAINLISEIDSIDLKGVWSGEYKTVSATGVCKLEITEVLDDGTVKGIYSYTPSKNTKYTQPGSYEVVGKINKDILHISLEAGEWIVEQPNAMSTAKADITAWLSIEEGNITGIGHSTCSFNMTKQ